MLAFIMIGLMLCSGLAIDIAFAYVTKARLQKAVDAACLVAMQNLSQAGQTGANTLATNTFGANYPVTGLDASAPTLNVNFTTNAGQQAVGVSAVANIRTIFLGLLPGRKSFNVAATAQALRGYLAMTIVVDRSGSMTQNGGQQAIQAAVPMFVDFFNNSTDQVALVSFASNATTDVAITTNFQAPITNYIKNTMSFGGGTFGPGGLTLAKAQEDSVVPTQGENLVKVVVYFTDGMVNTIQNTLACNSPLGNTLYNYGGYDAGTHGTSNYYDFFDPASGTDWSSQYSQQGWGLDSNGYPPHDASHDCQPVTQFTSQQTGQQENFSRLNITAEAQYRALQTANALRAEGVYVYSIGLGSDPSQTFLQEIANDPASPTYNSGQPVGEAVMAPDCSTPNSQKCNTELQQVFQTIASRILLRLTQ
jgi:hypothetical protein